MKRNKLENPKQTDLFKEATTESMAEEKEKNWQWFRLFKNGEATVHICYAPNDKVAYRAFEMARLLQEEASYGTPVVADDFFKKIPVNYLGREKMILVPVSGGKRKLPIKVVSYQNMK